MTDLHNDDQPVGRVLSRREVLALLGGSGAALIAATGFTRLNLSQLTTTAEATAEALESLPACVVRPALTEGPYFVDELLNRCDIRIEPSDGSVKDGKLLRLTCNVSDVSSNTCGPLPGAQIDIWHCDAQGWYSDVADPGFDTSGQKWLRGYQVTDDQGVANFVTIYPGWYSSRTVHIHFKIRTDPESDTGYEFTSQLFFPEDVTDGVHAQEPYTSKGYRDTLNVNDNIFQSSDDLLTLNVVELEDEDGYEAIFGIGLDLSQPYPSVSGGPGGMPGGGRPGGPPSPGA